MRVAALDDEVEILRDRFGIPHIYARTAHDLYFANGLVHAEDRLWQMEVNRRAARGRLSELFGKLTLDVDRFMRILGLGRAAEAELPLLDDQAGPMLDAYAAGVNWAIEARRRPIELMFLRHRPEPWSALDTLAWAKLMGWGISGNWGSELARVRLAAQVGPQLAAALDPTYPVGGWLSAAAAPLAGAATALDDAYRRLGELTGLSQLGGSNAWTVAPSRTDSGGAMVAADLHLAPQLPSVWYELSLHADDVFGRPLDLIGASLAGIPGIVNGHNGHVAWGTPASLADTQDLFVERPDPANPRRFARGDGWEDVRVVREEIRVRGRRGWHVEEVVTSSNGSVITPLLNGVEVPVSLRTTAAEPSRTLRSGLDVNRARSADEFRQALTAWGTPTLAFVFADKAGTIGYQLAGLVPRRARGNGAVPAPGWDREFAWHGFLSLDELPCAEDPSEGFIAAANNRPIGQDYPHEIGVDWCDSYRIARVVELLRARPRHDRDSLAAIQLDVTSCAARDFVARVRDILDGEQPIDPLERAALRELLDWDGRLDVESVGASIYHHARAGLLRFLYAPKLGDLLNVYLGAAPHGYSGSSFLWRIGSHLVRVMADPDWPERLGHRGLSWRDVVLIGLGEGVSALRLTYGEDVAGWRWGRMHRLRLDHHLARGRALRQLLSRGPFEMAGDGDTPFQTGAAPWSLGSDVSVAPSVRLVIDLANPSRSISIHAPGQSGQPGSRHYDDLLPRWLRGAYHPMLWTRAEVEANLESEARLIPTDELWPRP